ncbi:unnamed protein product [Blepharisma stoltei]|uniref:Uncharacterized protein n=1 Tax=Blepharisma stoltei TaxID=1481888 RepID=A0AAU9JLF9_9CILI|nr:unnamed protein product [Blepharisma stoltei]
MAGIKFNPDAQIIRFFVHQPPNVLLKSTTEHIQDETFQAQEMDQIKLKIRRNPFAEFDEEEEEERKLEVITYVSYENIWCTSVHFYINVILYDILASEVAQRILYFVKAFGPVQHIFIVKPNQATADDFTLGVEGALFGILMENANYAKPFLLKENKIEIPDLGYVAVFPGSMGEDVWNKFQKETNYLQGFFFVGKDMVDYRPECLCYFASLPKGSFPYRVAQEIRSHGIDEPIHMLKNPFEEKSIMRLEFREEKSVNALLKLCMKINNKPIIILPCLDRTPVEELYKAYEVLILGYNQTLHTGELLKALVNNFGPVVELVLNAGINNNGNQCTLVVFQTIRAVETCLKKGEIIVKKLRLRFEAVTRPYRLTGRMVFNRVYNSDPPVRPLEIIPSPYSFTEPLEG